MSATSAKRLRGRRRTNDPDLGSDDVLCYMDQGSFVGLRALGRGPALQLTWLYQHAINEATVEQFGERLARGLLGRLLQRSPLPWGRHRWVANHVPAPVTWFRDPIPEVSLPKLRSLLLNLPVDPERGPGWRLAVQALDGGGCALTMLVSHTIADMQATSEAITDAVADRRLVDGFPAPSWRWSPVMLARDSIESIRALPGVCRALAALVQMTRQENSGPSPLNLGARSSRDPAEPVVDVPLVDVSLSAGACQQRASDLGVASNTLIAAFAARLAFRIGRTDASGRVKLVLPVSDRHLRDRRGNALRSITLKVNPDLCGNDLRSLQRDLKAALALLARNGDDASRLLPLVPYVPLWLARHLELAALGRDRPVGCSLIGELPPDLNRAFGEASLLQISLLERYTASELERLGGVLFIPCYRVGGRLCLTVSGYEPGRVTSRSALAPFVSDALVDIGLCGTVS